MAGIDWSRIWRHLRAGEGRAHRVFDAAAQARVAARVADSERRHTGEIRVCIEGALPWSWLWRGASAHERALAEFAALGVWDTAANNGVLVYLLLADRQIEIVADRGLNPHADAAHWRQALAGPLAAFAAGRFEEGLLQAIDVVDAMLTARFPAAPDAENPDELPDTPVLQ